MTMLMPQQRAIFEAALKRRSRGQVRLPRGAIGASEAIALWREACAAFGVADRAEAAVMLSPFELASLRKRVAARSGGTLALTEAVMTRAAGLALWRLAGALGLLAQRRSQGPYGHVGRAAGAAAIGLAATQLAACTALWGGNIKGSFSCSAPGGSCAPSTVIDDQALAVIQNARPMTPQTRLSAGRYDMPPAHHSARAAGLSSRADRQLALAAPGMVHREQRVLRVVFPSYVDAAGNLHEPRVVHTVADAGGWMELSNGEPNVGEQLTARGAASANTSSPSSQLALPSGSLDPSGGAEDAPAQQRLPANAKALAASPAPSSSLDANGPPDPRAVADARARGAAHVQGSALDAIKAEVTARLAKTAKAPASPDPSATSIAPPSPAVTVLNPKAPIAGVAAAPDPSATAPANTPAPFPGKVEE